LIIIAGIAAVLSSCRKDAVPDSAGRDDALQINVTAAGFTFGNIGTKAFNTGYTTTLSTGDRIGITVVKDGAIILENNIPYVYNGSAWNPVNPASAVHYFPGSNIDYLVYYPYSPVMDGKMTTAEIVANFSPQTDQSAQNAYDASDLMTGVGVLNGIILSVTLTHALSLIEFNFPTGVSSVLFEIEGGATLIPFFFEGAYRYIARSQNHSVVLTGSYTEGSEKKYWQLANVMLTAGKTCRINIFPPFFIEGYMGGIQVFYTDGTNEIATITDNGILKLVNSAGKTIMRIVLLDKGNKDYLIGRTTEQPICLKFDANGDLLFRPAIVGYVPIGSYAEFQKINGDATSRAGNYRQEANLDLMNMAWTPVGNNSNRFTGACDGNHKTISRLSINSASMDYAGLFGAIGVGGLVQNFDIIDVNITGRNYVGSMVGHSEGSITNCKTDGKISGADYTGGIAGYTTRSSIKACNSGGSVNGRDWVGGITGYLTIGSSVETCVSNALVNGRDRVGGIAGCVFTANGETGNPGSTINACKSAGTVIGTGNMIGGIAGQVIRNNNTVRNCYSTGNISGANNVGGVVGNVNDSSVEYCYATGAVNGTSSIGGVAGLVNTGGFTRNCVALNPIVQASTSNIGRVAYPVGGNLIYNLAWDGMSNGSGIPFTGGVLVAHNRANGKNITSSQARMRTTYVDYVDSDLPAPLGWDFINTWKINEGNGYPTLQWE